MGSHKIRRVDYFYVSVKDEPGQSLHILQQMADLGVNMLAFAAVPAGAHTTMLTLFPEDSAQLQTVAKRAGMNLIGPHGAFLVQGSDELGALIGVHKLLYDANVNIYSSTAVTDGHCCYGYLIYVRPERYEDAARALGV
jgi:hypothetical protein